VSTVTPAAGDSIIARCLLDPEFLSRVSSDPATALAAYPLDERTRRDFEAFDFGSVRSFAGFITKVQHNDLWESIPGTRSVLKYYGVEIETFAAYHPHHLRLRARRITRDEKVAAFLDFLEARLAREPSRRYPGLRDILVHERLQWEIRTALTAGVDGVGEASDGRGGRFERLVPVIRGALRVGSFEISPSAIASQLAAGRFEPSELRARRHCLAYWGDPEARELHVLEVDELTAVLLAEVDGCRSAGAVVRRVARRLGVDAVSSRFQPVFESAAAHGLLELRRRERGA
jgi:hypothetical protein